MKMKAYVIMYKDKDGFLQTITHNHGYMVYDNMNRAFDGKSKISSILKDKIQGKPTVVRKRKYLIFWENVTVYEKPPQWEIAIYEQMLSTLIIEECNLLCPVAKSHMKC